MNKYYPDAFSHMNHVPGQSWDHYLPRDGKIYNYEDFLTEYANVILKRLKGCLRSLCLDNYPFIGNNYMEKTYMLVNYTDPIRKCTSTVTLHGNGVTQLRLYQDGKESVLQAKDGKFTITLEPGNAAFITW